MINLFMEFLSVSANDITFRDVKFKINFVLTYH